MQQLKKKVDRLTEFWSSQVQNLGDNVTTNFFSKIKKKEKNGQVNQILVANNPKPYHSTTIEKIKKHCKKKIYF
jgi:hypothetical protein